MSSRSSFRRWLRIVGLIVLVGLTVTLVRVSLSSMPEVRTAPAIRNGTATLSGSWPQWRGPNRTGLSTEVGMLRQWPQNGPPLLWRASGLGEGYSSPVVFDGRVFTMGLRGQAEFVIALDLGTGQEIWTAQVGSAFRNDRGSGPRGTPTIDTETGLLYGMGGNGDLACLNCENGAEVWERNILQDFGGRNISWGISESVLVDAGRVIATPGGRDACMVALDKATGELIWKSKGLSDSAGYASAVAGEVGGIRQYATFTSRGVVAVAADDGRFLWRYDRPANGTANIATPIFYHDMVFATSDYGTGCGLVKLLANGSTVRADEVYFNREMKNHHGGVVLVDGYLYGFSSSILTCMEFATGKVAWKDRSVGKGSLVYADGHLYCLSEDGVLGLVECTPRRYLERSRFRLSASSARPTWSHPAIAGAKLFVRDQDMLWCFDIADRALSRKQE